jgi:hypothetical protein
MQVIALTVSAFQAGHEGSIPFARSAGPFCMLLTLRAQDEAADAHR